jgi:hypothetical protein
VENVPFQLEVKSKKKTLKAISIAQLRENTSLFSYENTIGQNSNFSLTDYRQTISATSKAAPIVAPIGFFEVGRERAIH